MTMRGRYMKISLKAKLSFRHEPSILHLADPAHGGHAGGLQAPGEAGGRQLSQDFLWQTPRRPLGSPGGARHQAEQEERDGRPLS